ncbi:MAG: DUF4197 domain-containing protein [Rhodospirillales bacterium]|nr:DUF4197 domain-containing protein [Rhodospirillales bacterium]MBO6786635.1 DUF4197 domain-containing protein [Rhodospirillales bacterium]
MRRALAAIGCAAMLLAGAGADASFLDKLKGAVDQVTGSGGTSGSSTGGLATDQIVAGLKEALRVGAERVVGQVGAVDGFNADPQIHIPLPDQLAKVQDIMRKFGLSALADDVELKLNRAAEEAAPKTKELIWKAVNEMTLDDAKKIYDGPEDAATQCFRRVATPDLKATVEPVVDNALQQVGAITAYDTLMSRYKGLPLVPDVKADLKAHATALTLDGIFHYLAKEEAAIRANPAARTTDILKQVFGSS